MVASTRFGIDCTDRSQDAFALKKDVQSVISAFERVADIELYAPNELDRADLENAEGYALALFALSGYDWVIALSCLGTRFFPSPLVRKAQTLSELIGDSVVFIRQQIRGSVLVFGIIKLASWLIS